MAFTGAPRLAAADPPAPAERRSSLTVVHGMTLDDPYAWLKAENWQAVLRDPAALPAEIRALLVAENAHATAVLAPTVPLQRALKREMRGRIEEEDSDVPVADGPFVYYERHREGGQHAILCRRPREGGEEAILLDGDALAEGKAFFDLGDAAHSPDHGLLAWSADDRGSELHTIQVRDLATGTDRADRVTDADGEIVWFADGASFLYVRIDENHRASRVYRHRLGDSADDDALVFSEPDPGWFVSIAASAPADFAVVSVHGHDAARAT